MKKHLLAGLGVGAALALPIGGGVAVAMHQASADSSYERVELPEGQWGADGAPDEEMVESQSTSAARSSAVDSQQLTRVPNVVGLTGTEAGRILQNAGLAASTYVPAAGIVQSQAPEAGRSVRAGYGVMLTYTETPRSYNTNQGTAGGYTYGGGSNSSNQGTAGGYTYGGY